MATYTLRLDQLHCSFIRDKENDDLNAVMTVMVNGFPIDPGTGGPIDPDTPPEDYPSISGLLATGVHTGDTIIFKDAAQPQNAGAWEFSFNIPNDTADDVVVKVDVCIEYS